MTAFKPGQSPPPVRTPTFIRYPRRSQCWRHATRRGNDGRSTGIGLGTRRGTSGVPIDTKQQDQAPQGRAALLGVQRQGAGPDRFTRRRGQGRARTRADQGRRPWRRGVHHRRRARPPPRCARRSSPRSGRAHSSARCRCSTMAPGRPPSPRRHRCTCSCSTPAASFPCSTRCPSVARKILRVLAERLREVEKAPQH